MSLEKVPPSVSEMKTSETRSIEEMKMGVRDVLLDTSLKIKAGDHLLILMHPSGWHLANLVTEEARKRGAEVNIRYYHAEAEKPALEGYSSRDTYAMSLEAQKYTWDENTRETVAIHTGFGLDKFHDIGWANKYLIIRNKMSSGTEYNIRPEDQSAFDDVEAAIVRLRNDDHSRRWTLIYEPNEQEAELAGLTLDEYRRVYYDAIDRPWDEVEKAQKFMIDFLANKKTFSVKAPAPEGFPAG